MDHMNTVRLVGRQAGCLPSWLVMGLCGVLVAGGCAVDVVDDTHPPEQVAEAVCVSWVEYFGGPSFGVCMAELDGDGCGIVDDCVEVLAQAADGDPDSEHQRADLWAPGGVADWAQRLLDDPAMQ